MKRILFLLVAGLFFTSSLFSQKVAVVLSGGGAKGLSHIGLLRALEENNIPIDYIAGTSMGAIIGGLYAAGYSPDEMEEIFKSPEFPTWISGTTNPKYINQTRQLPENPSWLNVNFDFNFKDKFKVHLPANFIAPTQMDLAFLSIFSAANAKSKGNFDSLYIPFRAVASDVEANEAYIPDHGDLGQIVRASMTFPFYFKPIHIEGRLLFDGGIYNNFPADVVKERFKPDYIIGSDVADRNVKINEDNVLIQLEHMIMRKTDYSIDGPGVLIYTENKVESVIDFSNIDGIIEAGYNNALKYIDEIKATVKRTVNKSQREASRKAFKTVCPKVVIDSIELNGLNEKQKTYARRLLSSEIDSLTLDNFQEKYYEFNTDPRIKSTFPSLHYNPETNHFGLNLDVTKKGAFTAGIGGSVSSSPTDQIYIQTNYEFFGRQIYSVYFNYYAGNFYNSGYISAKLSDVGYFPYYIEVFASLNRWNYFRNKTYFFDDDNPAYLIENQDYYGAQIVGSIKNQNKVGLNVSQVFNTFDYYQTNLFSAKDTADRSRFNPLVTKLFFEHNSLNRKVYASEGGRLKLAGRFVYGRYTTTLGNTSVNQLKNARDYQYLSFDLNYEQYFRLGRNLALGIQYDMSYSDKELLDNYTLTMLNANVFNPTPESMTQFMPQFRANQFAALGLKGVITLFNNMDLRLEGYIFQPFRTILNDNTKPHYSEFLEIRSAALSAVLVYHTPIGPVSLSLNYYPQDDIYKHVNFMFNLGITMFNPRNL